MYETNALESCVWGRLRKRTTKHANGWRVRLNPKKLRRKRQTRQETALI